MSKEDYLDQDTYIVGNRSRATPKVLARLFEFYVSGPITGPEDYVEDFDVIRHAGPDDDVRIYLNSGGGVLATAIQWMRVLAETQAHVTVSVEGDCMSAATMIFLAADEFQITRHSSFMIHNYSGGTGGKGHEIYAQVQYERKWSERLLKEIYEDFLSPAEINSVLEGKDIWLDVDEVVERMTARLKVRQEQTDAEQRAAEKAVAQAAALVEAPVAKAKPKKVKDKDSSVA